MGVPQVRTDEQGSLELRMCQPCRLQIGARQVDVRKDSLAKVGGPKSTAFSYVPRVIPFGPGGIDTLSRLVAEPEKPLGSSLGWKREKREQ